MHERKAGGCRCTVETESIFPPTKFPIPLALTVFKQLAVPQLFIRMQGIDNALVRLSHGFKRLQGNVESLVSLNTSIVQFHSVLSRWNSSVQWAATSGVQFPRPSSAPLNAAKPIDSAKPATRKRAISPPVQRPAETQEAPEAKVARRKSLGPAQSAHAKANASIIALLPQKYKVEEHKTRIVAILDALRASSDGMFLQDLVAVSGTTKLLCNEYLVQIVRIGAAVRESRKGLLYKLKAS